MVKNRELFALGLVVLLTLLVFSSTISAEYSVGENKSYELSKKKYGPGENVEGWINISFIEEPVDGLFTWGDYGATLKQLLQGSSGLNADYDNYSCNFDNCEAQYITLGEGSTEKSALLNDSDSAIFGFDLEGDIDRVESASFNISSNAYSSCENQIEIDLFADDEIDMINTNNHPEVCGGEGDYGCFDETHSLTDFVFDSSNFKYCQKINISRSPGIEVGAFMKNKSGSTNLTMRIYDMNDNFVEDCDLPYPSDEWGEVNCSLDHMFVEKEEPYYVCIERTTEVIGEYFLKGYIPEEDEEKCGSNSLSPFEPTKAYQIFAKEKKFGSIDEFEVTGEDFTDKMENYLEKEYGDMDCSSHECIIPVKIKSNIDNQSVAIKSADVKINYAGGGSSYIENIYNANKVPANISSSYDKFYFNDGNFTIPDETGNFTFDLSYKGESIITEELTIVEIPSDISLSPLETSTVIETDFEVSATSAGNITSYSWDFGDNNTATTTENTVSHIYESTGNYTVAVNLTDEFGRQGSESFNILVSEPEDYVRSELSKKKSNLEDFESDLNSYDIFKKDMLEKHLDITENKEILNDIDNNISGGNDTDWEDFARKLIGIEIPSSISQTASGSGLPTSSDSKYISPNVISSITEEDFNWEEEGDYVQAIEEWNTVNLNNRISYEEYTVQFNGNPKSFDFFELAIVKRPQSTADEFYFVMEELENLEFSELNTSTISDGYVYDRLTGEKTISIFTTEDTSFENLPYFVSPKLSEINITETDIEPEEPEEGGNWLWYVITVVVLAILGLVGYYFLQRWYDHKYEDSLFKDKNKLYNLANYVTQAKKNGMSNSEIKKNLKKADWSGEQIRYVMKKYAGKRTGLPKLFGSIFGTDKPKKPKKSQGGRGQRSRRQRRSQR